MDSHGPNVSFGTGAATQKLKQFSQISGMVRRDYHISKLKTSGVESNSTRNGLKTGDSQIFFHVVHFPMCEDFSKLTSKTELVTIFIDRSAFNLFYHIASVHQTRKPFEFTVAFIYRKPVVQKQ